jgi:acyl carrier protein
MENVVTPQAVEDRIFEMLTTFGADPKALSRDATFEELDIDSLDLVELAQIVDEEYSVQVSTADAEKLKTVGDAIELIVSRMP